LVATGILCRLLTRRFDEETMKPEAKPAENG